MATRCIVEVFTTGEGVAALPEPSHLVYQHWDGDPDTVRSNVEKALALAWPLPRFEPDEFAAAYVAATKTGPGNVRLLRSHDDVPGDVCRWHRVYVFDGGLYVSSFACDGAEITHPMGKRVLIRQGKPPVCKACGQKVPA